MSNIHDIAAIAGVKSYEADSMLKEVQSNMALLDGCQRHAFTICINRYTKQPIENPTPVQSFGAKWQCERCGGLVEGQEKRWYDRGLKAAVVIINDFATGLDNANNLENEATPLTQQQIDEDIPAIGKDLFVEKSKDVPA